MATTRLGAAASAFASWRAGDGIGADGVGPRVCAGIGAGGRSGKGAPALGRALADGCGAAAGGCRVPAAGCAAPAAGFAALALELAMARSSVSFGSVLGLRLAARSKLRIAASVLAP